MALTSCCLCSFACNEFKCLQDADGKSNEVYEIVTKYFHSSLLDDAKIESTIKVLCLECWQHISDFHNFHQWILNARTQEDLKFIIKEEDSDERTTGFDATIENAIKSNTLILTPSKEISMFECNHCKELFQSYKALDTHFKLCQGNVSSNEESNAKHNLFERKIVKIISERDKNAFKCETCDASFSQYGNLRRHIRKQHAVQPLLKWICKYCNKLFKKKSLLDKHKRELHKTQPSERSNFSFKPDIEDENMELNVMDNPSPAKTIAKSQIHKPALEIIDVKSEVPTDEESDDEINSTNLNEFGSESDEKADNDLEVQNTVLECPRCGELARNFTQLEKHFDDKHPDERCYINCCNLTLYERQSVLEHLRFHKNPNAFKCTECGKCFKGRKGLRSHQLQVHSDNRSTYHLHLCCCKASVERHETNLAKGQQMKYDTRVCCQRKKKILEDDELIAKWRKELTCEICKANFPFYSLMRSHSYYEHPGEKCYILCCQRKMSRISDTLEHIRFHLNPHLYRCQKCNVDFSGKTTLVKHMRKAHRESLPKHRWACDECDKTFEIRHILTRHKNVCHSKKKFD